MITDYILRGQLHVLCQEYPIRVEETGARWVEASAMIQGEMWGVAGVLEWGWRGAAGSWEYSEARICRTSQQVGRGE